MDGCLTRTSVSLLTGLLRKARLNLEKTRTEKTSQSALLLMQQQIEELRVQVLELQLKLEMLASR